MLWIHECRWFFFWDNFFQLPPHMVVMVGLEFSWWEVSFTKFYHHLTPLYVTPLCLPCPDTPSDL